MGPIPNYTSDLNACHQMEATLSEDEKCGWDGYYARLADIVGDGTPSGREGGDPPWWYGSMASAASGPRCQAFLKVKGFDP